MYTARRSEIMYPLAGAFADAVGAGANASAWVNVRDYHRLWLVINVGEMQATSTLDAVLQQATTTGGAGGKAILAKNQVTNKAITQLTAAGGDSDSLVCIELQTEELDVSNGFDCVRFVITIALAVSEYSAILYGCESRHMAVPTANWTEIID